MAKYIVQVAPAAKESESPEYRSYLAPDAPIKAPFGVKNVSTINDLVNYGCKKFEKLPFVGQREFIKLHVETKEVTKKINGEDKRVKKDWQYYELGHYDWQTFGEFQETRKTLSSSLIKAGLKPGEDKFHIYAKTCREWMQVATALTTQNIPMVTAYDTLGIEGLRESINQTETRGILLDKDNIPNLAEVLEHAPSIKVVVYRDSEGELSDELLSSLEDIKTKNGGIEVYSFSEFLKLGEGEAVEFHEPKPDDICCIMYTSGSTGPPKGVVLLHSTVLAGVSGANGNVPNKFVHDGDVFLAILPLAHILEFTAELISFVWGTAIGYGNPKTISDVNMRNSLGDMRELRPTIIIGVPAVFEAIKKGISHKVGSAPSLVQKVFWGAYKLKSTLKSLHLPVPLLDSVIFKNIKEATGGRLRYVMNGGAPVSISTREFINTLIAPLIMGYGLTETNAMCALMQPDLVDMDTTGEIVPAITVKLVDVADAGYFAKNNQGEFWVKGPALSPGYWKNEKETKDAYTDDGWFMSGDVCEFTKDGKLKVIDRKKNLVKTLNGEYVAVERLEALYRSNKYVSNICVFADSEHAKPVAVVVPLEQGFKTLAKELGIEYTDTMMHDKKVVQAVIKSLQDTAIENKLRPVEWIAGITISDEEWTPQNRFVTSAQKVQRKKIAQEYKDGIAEAFKSA